MTRVLVTGSADLVGSAAVTAFAGAGRDVIGTTSTQVTSSPRSPPSKPARDRPRSTTWAAAVRTPARSERPLPVTAPSLEIQLIVSYDDTARRGAHIWWISDYRKFQSHYPEWTPENDLNQVLASVLEGAKQDAH